MHNSRVGKSPGFTLLELILVLAVIGILTAVAYPVYIDSIRATRRSEAMSALLHIQNLQAKYRSNHIIYGTLVEIGFTTVVPPALVVSEGGYYTFAISGVDAIAYTITATGVSGMGQENDKAGSTSCSSLTLTVAAASPRGEKAPADCWKK